MSIDDYFLKMAKDLAFIELKDREHMILPTGVSLPLWTDTLVAGIYDGTLIEEVPLNAIWEGMVAILGIDERFIYNDLYIEAMHQLHDDPETAMMALASYYNGKKDLIKTAIALRALLYLNPYHEDALANLAAVYAELSEMEESQERKQEWLREAIQLVETLEEELPKPFVKNFLARLYMADGQYLKAQLTLQDVEKEADEKSLVETKRLLLDVKPLAVAQLIENAIKAGRMAEAEQYMQEAWAIYDTEPSIIFLKAILLFEAGESEAAFELLEELIESHPQVMYYNQLIAQLYAIDQYEQAKRVAQKGVETFPDEATLMANLAMSCAACGQIKEAENWMDQAIENCETEDLREQLNSLQAMIKETKNTKK